MLEDLLTVYVNFLFLIPVTAAYQLQMDFMLPWELEGVTSPYCLLIGQYPHHMTLCPPVAIVKRYYGIHQYNTTLLSAAECLQQDFRFLSYKFDSLVMQGISWSTQCHGNAQVTRSTSWMQNKDHLNPHIQTLLLPCQLSVNTDYIHRHHPRFHVICPPQQFHTHTLAMFPGFLIHE